MAEPKSRLKRTLKILAILFLVTFLAWFIAGMWAKGRVDSALAKLEVVTGTTEQLKARFPHGDANAAALKLEELTTQLSVEGLSLVPKHRPAEAAPTARDRRFRNAVATWMRKQLEDASGTISEPPAELRIFLAEHGATLDEIQELLLQEDAPRWEQALFDEGPRAPMPNLLGHINLTRLLIARSLLEAHDGKDLQASRHLEAAWAFANDLDVRADLISRLIGIAELRFVAAALRKLENDDGAWLARLDDIPALQDPGDLFVGETVVPVTIGTSRSQRDLTAAVGEDLGRPWVFVLAKPFVRAGAAEGITAYAKLIELQRTADPCEVVKGADLGFDPADEISSWNIPMQMALPNLMNVGPRLQRVALDAAVTRQVIEARRAAAEGRTGTVEVVSERCAEWRWTRTIEVDGSLSLEWIGPEVWTNPNGPAAPLSFSLVDERAAADPN